MAITGSNIFIILVSIVAPIIYSGQVAFLIQKLNELCHWKHGCNPIPPLGNVTLHYFAGRGRAEPIRLLMEDQMIPYHEVVYDEETWLAHAQQNGEMVGLFTFGQVPAITTSRHRRLAQKVPVLHYLCRSVGLDCDCSDIARCEMIAAGVEELQRKQYNVINVNFSAESRNKYIRTILQRWLLYFEKLVSGDSVNWYFSTGGGVGEDGPYFASGRLTWIDYLVFDMVESNCDFLEYTKTGSQQGVTLDSDHTLEMPDSCFHLLEKFPHLSIFINNFRGRTNIGVYMNSGHRNAYKLPLIDL